MKHFQEVYQLAVWTVIFQMFPSTCQSGLKGVHQVHRGQWTSKVNRILVVVYIFKITSQCSEGYMLEFMGSR